MATRPRWSLLALFAAAAAASSLTGAAQTTATFTFAAAGDFTLKDEFSSHRRGCSDQQTGLLLALGDLSYEEGGERSWCKHWLPYQNVLLVAGNHDTGEDSGGRIENYITHCGTPFKDYIKGTYGRQYYFDYPVAAPLARFIMVTPGIGGDTGGLNTNYVKGSAGYGFTEAAIDEAKSKGIKWIFVGMHKNYISVMRKDNEISEDSKRTFMTMLLNKRVDVILQGHEHGYERTKQLATNDSTCPLVPTETFSPKCVVDGDDALVKGARTVIHIIGTAGKDMRNLNRKDSEFDYFVDRFAWSEHQAFGFGSFAVTAQRLSYKFVGSKGPKFVDEFTITEGPSK